MLYMSVFAAFLILWYISAAASEDTSADASADASADVPGGINIRYNSQNCRFYEQNIDFDFSGFLRENVQI